VASCLLDDVVLRRLLVGHGLTLLPSGRRSTTGYVLPRAVTTI
jgi:hypothetical protein